MENLQKTELKHLKNIQKYIQSCDLLVESIELCNITFSRLIYSLLNRKHIWQNNLATWQILI